MSAEHLVSLQSRRTIRDRCSSSVKISDIEGCWESGNFTKVRPAESQTRKLVFDAYAEGVDWTDEGQTRRALHVFERMLRLIQRGNERANHDDDFRDVREAFAEDGYQVNERLQIVRFGAERPEHAISPAQSYADCLRILRNARSQLERSPRLTSLLDEEPLRDVLLVALNGFFEGRGTGETANGEGKTDILVRVADRNVLVGECKIWRGQQYFTDGLTQLLRYLAWNDTFAALPLFIRNKRPTDVVTTAVEAIKVHPNFSQIGKVDDEIRQVDFVMKSALDSFQKVSVALIPFVVAERVT
ncbi:MULTISPECIES: hypothetical protein [Streptomyces]|uniref:hypothetical protein n=1 Tax=Streptomyces TaxID=1883 RepID=UPI00240E74BC|nr:MULTISPECIES: hypothetical protein [Streptomyces]WFB85605.1 hypothetical protein MMU79_20995 [Streptomyces olivaceus]WGK48769.1 hypothetical protein M6G09_26000 [Streptomyces sp. B146]